MMRQRADGSWTYSTEEWDHVWHWTVGTRVRLVNDEVGTVTKVNRVTVDVDGDSGRKYCRVPMRLGLVRV